MKKKCNNFFVFEYRLYDNDSFYSTIEDLINAGEISARSAKLIIADTPNFSNHDSAVDFIEDRIRELEGQVALLRRNLCEST